MALEEKKITNVQWKSIHFDYIKGNKDDVEEFIKLLGLVSPEKKQKKKKKKTNKKKKGITLKKIIETFTEKYKNENTRKNYTKFITNVVKDEDDLDELFNDQDKLIAKIYGMYQSSSTRKSYLSAVISVLKEYKLPHEKVLHEIQNQATINDIQTSETDPIGSYEDAVEMMKGLQTKADELETNMGDKYDLDRQMYSIAYFILNYGAMRTAEMITIQVVDKPIETNHINVKTGEMIITDHKTVKSMGKKVIQLDKPFLDIIKPALGNYWVLGKNRRPYTSSKGLEVLIEATFGVGLYPLRKAKVSIALHNKNPDAIRRLETVHGHTLSTMISNYNSYK